MRNQDQADVVLYAPAEDLFAYREPRRNRRREKVEDPLVASSQYAGLLVRTALIRSSDYQKVRETVLDSARKVAVLLRHLAAANQEHFITIPLNNNLNALAIHETGIGTSDATMISPPDVFRVVLLTAGSGVIVAHNHPSGRPVPSKDDQRTLESLKVSGKCIGITVYDMIIVAGDGWLSMGLGEEQTW